jgi:hypothetical protein
MVLIGCDFHPSWQQVSWLNQETGESGDGKLVHEAGAVEKFYRQFPAGSRIGMEATGNCQWFLELLAKLGHEVWIGDAAKIRASDARQRQARCTFVVAVAGGRAVSTDLGSFAGTERSAARVPELRSQPLWHHAMLHSSATEKFCLTTPSLSSKATRRLISGNY